MLRPNSSRGIRVNAVAPGVIDTDMSNFTKTDDGNADVEADHRTSQLCRLSVRESQPLAFCAAQSMSFVGQFLPPTFSNATAEVASTPDAKARCC
jgi:NAD(P)-dependent dehydrogenase (short-subunit alcohol dehydrogenase family)